MRICSQLGLVFAALPLAIVALLISEPKENLLTSFLALFLFLCPMVAVCLGHLALRQQKKRLERGGQRGSGHTAAMITLLGGYSEICLLLLAALVPCRMGYTAASEATAVGSLRALAHAAEEYRQAHPVEGFPADLSSLAPVEGTPRAEWTVDTALASGEKRGYRFTYVGGGRHFQILADPTLPRRTGYRHFYVDEAGVVRWEVEKPATVESAALN